MVSVLSLVVLVSVNSFSQDSTFKFIFVPHVRSEDETNQTVNPGIAKIDFSRYSLKMLGGDLAPQTSKSEKTMKYLDSLFDLKNPNTLWTLGNHDLEEGDSNLIKKYTGKPLFYPYARDGIQFMVLNTELSAVQFSETYIKSPQLDTLKAVCARVTSADTKFFVVLHSRYMWMIGNTYFTKAKFLDSIAASSKSLTKTNWYTEVEPQLQLVRAKGIKVLVFGGDKSQINVTYVKDSITYYAARMENTFIDEVNNVITLDYVKNKSITCKYVTLNKINDPVAAGEYTVFANNTSTGEQAFAIRQAAGSRRVNFQLPTTHQSGLLQIYSIDGALVRSISIRSGEISTVRIDKAGTYVARVLSGNSVQIRNFIVQ